MAQIFIKPAAGLKVRHVEKIVSFIPEEGEWVEDNSIWQRRLNEGDVYLAEDPQQEKLQSKSSKKESAITNTEGDKL